MPIRTAVARNFSEASENKIHSDDIAKRFGFTGALVPGVAVFGRGSDGVVVECTIESAQPAVDPRACISGPGAPEERVEIAWDTVHVDEPFAPFVWQPDDSLNCEYAARVDDDTAIFQQGVLHPHAILSQANQVLVRRFIMPAWIHTGSEVRFRRLLRVGEEIEVRAVPLEKWERKGHQLIKLYCAYAVRGEIATEIWHTAIFRVAAKQSG